MFCFNFVFGVFGVFLGEGWEVSWVFLVGFVLFSENNLFLLHPCLPCKAAISELHFYKERYELFTERSTRKIRVNSIGQ